MTELIYYKDSTIDCFRADVISIEKTGAGYDIILSKTCFYPEGGGQPADKGTIKGLSVINVQKRDGIVVHTLEPNGDAPLPFPGETVDGEIDIEHRLDFMQQHSGQHVISAALMKFGIATISVHQGEEYTSIETNSDTIDDETLAGIEEEANHTICLNVPIIPHLTDSKGLSAFNLRRPTKHRENIRIIEIPGIDCVACGGLHLETTGEINLVKLIDKEKIRGHIRTLWKIGKRARDDYREKTSIINKLDMLFSSQQHELPEKTENLLNTMNELKFKYNDLQTQYSNLYAKDLLSGAKTTSKGTKVIIEVFEQCDKSFISSLVKSLAASDESVNALIFNKSGGKLTWAAVSNGSEKDENSTFDFNLFKTDFLSIVDGKGGGRAPIWQGAANNPDRLDELVTKLRETPI